MFICIDAQNSILSSTLAQLFVLFYIPTGDGVMERWSAGVLGKEIESENFHYSNTPLLQHSPACDQSSEWSTAPISWIKGETQELTCIIW
jgi:hypothetical protein